MNSETLKRNKNNNKIKAFIDYFVKYDELDSYPETHQDTGRRIDRWVIREMKTGSLWFVRARKKWNSTHYDNRCIRVHLLPFYPSTIYQMSKKFYLLSFTLNFDPSIPKVSRPFSSTPRSLEIVVILE